MEEMITADDAQYALGLVAKICRQAGPGLPGSPQERLRAGIILQEMEACLGAENVALEEFTLAPEGFQGSLRSAALFTLIAALLNISLGRFPALPPLLTSLAALVFALLALLPVLIDTILYREFIDPLLKQKPSVNIIGSLRKPGTQEVKRLLIVSGHHDSDFEFTWLRILGGIYRRLAATGKTTGAGGATRVRILSAAFVILTGTMFLGTLVMGLASLIQLVGVILGNAPVIRFGTLGWVILAYPLLPSILIGLTYTGSRKHGGTVPGAADNLSASAAAVAMGRFLVNHPSFIPDDTELRFISFGSEEAGLRGSSRYVARHLDELRRLDVRVLNYEVISHPVLDILTTDVSGVKNSPELVESVRAAAERAGLPHKVKNNPTSGGGSDAGPFSRAGLKALTVMPFQMPQQMLAFYHQKWDRPEVLSKEPMLNALKLTLEWIRHGG